MREISFRGKRVDNGEWVEGYYTELPIGSLGATIFANDDEVVCEDTESYIIKVFTKQHSNYSNGNPLCVVECEKYDVDPSSVGQYTGLTDKNGKQIFEGDIIRYADLYDYNCYLESIDNPEVYDNIDLGNIWTIDEVVYGIRFGYPAFDLNEHDFETNGLSELSESGQFFYEVIGNIHDNPELRKR